MLVVVLSGFILALAVPFLHRLFRNRTGWLLATLPAGLFAYLTLFIKPVADGGVFSSRYPWVPSLDIEISFYLDGLSLLFGLIITGIGTLVLIYANAYLAGQRGFARFYVCILSFMGAMLGVVLGGDLITLFVFWELTSLTSYLLIGTENERESARSAAWQALLVTSLGGLALLAGFLMLGKLGGSFELPVLLSKGAAIRSQTLYGPIFILILLGAMTKSAQFPFHFWLPNAMATPTPVSTYLHSATMVKAGVYLLARLSPVLGGTPLWKVSILAIGATTMLIGAYLSIEKTDMKAILAYSTVAILGVLVFLLGLGTRAATEALITYLIIHCLYKAALFLISGCVYRLEGSYDLKRLGGLCRGAPWLALLFLIPALSLAGVPPSSGFWGKLVLVQSGLTAGEYMVVAVALLVSLLTLYSMTKIWNEAFWKNKPSEEAHRRTPVDPTSSRASWMALIFPVILLALFTLTIGLGAEFLLSLASKAAEQLMDPTQYISHVLGEMQ
jgi:multicomponent Na+:H+ antiporter subunit A